MNSDFRILINFKKFIFSLDDLLINFPKKEKILKDRFMSLSYEIVELIFYANLVDDKLPIQKQILSKISSLDFFLEFSWKKKYISEKQCQNKCNELLAITKMIYGWIKNE